MKTMAGQFGKYRMKTIELFCRQMLGQESAIGSDENSRSKFQNPSSKAPSIFSSQ
jgi:hypothetical protein